MNLACTTLAIKGVKKSINPSPEQSGGVHFCNSVLKIQCRVVKNALLQTAFSAILPLGVFIILVIMWPVSSLGKVLDRIPATPFAQCISSIAWLI